MRNPVVLPITLYASGRQTVGLGSIVGRVCCICCIGTNI